MDERDAYRPYQPHMQTSREAAKLDHRSAREEVRWELEKAGKAGLTDNELIRLMVAKGMNLNTPRARRIELVRMGQVVDAGWARDGCTVWVLKRFYNPQRPLIP